MLYLQQTFSTRSGYPIILGFILNNVKEDFLNCPAVYNSESKEKASPSSETLHGWLQATYTGMYLREQVDCSTKTDDLIWAYSVWRKMSSTQ